MKKYYHVVLITLLMTTNKTLAQNDSIYFWKSGQVILKKSIKPADLDTITFYTPIIPQTTICSQIWKTKNLDVSTYSDGTPIPQVTSVTAWKNLTTGAWCYYNNDPANGAVYGKLYNWYAVAGIYNDASLSNPRLRKKLAPSGWHIPTQAEWTTLTDCLGGLSVAGGKMKEVGTLHWNSPNTGATNSSGFRALGAGSISFTTNTFLWLLRDAYFWSSTETNTTQAWFKYISFSSEGVITNGTAQKIGPYSVRCIKD